MQNSPIIRLWLALLATMSLLAVAPLEAQDAPATAVTCKDGSSSNAGRGACSHHGGVNKNAAASTSATGSTAASSSTRGAAANASAVAPPASSTASSTAAGRPSIKPADSNAAKVGSPSAKCKDGTMSYSKTHSGTCSHHGGVAEFLDK